MTSGRKEGNISITGLGDKLFSAIEIDRRDKRVCLEMIEISLEVQKCFFLVDPAHKRL